MPDPLVLNYAIRLRRATITV
ncbi:unnamed protein product, partial [Rotaria sp. Silwood1]